jgi:NAD(P)-dependent dehydrogenase (short-subunit alcohol dehydrogenase family)
MFMRRLLALIAVLLVAAPLHAATLKDPASPTILLTGANRGVGLALVKQYAGEGWNVIATCRDPKSATELQALAKANPKILVERLDVASSKQLEGLARRYRGVPIDVLFNNAALLGDRDDKGNRRQKFGSLDEELFTEVMRVNVLAPLLISEAFVDNVAASQQKKIVGMTSGLGSLTLMGRMSSFYFYQMSKAALNMGFRAMRNDLMGKGITVALLAPGMVETDMLAESGFSGKALSPAESAAGLYKLVAELTPADKGLPVNVDGKVVPW